MVARSSRVCLRLIQQIKGAAHATEHAKPEHIDFHEFERVDIVLVPLDHLAIIHRRRFDRHQLIEPIERQDKAARMLREVARRADQLLRKFEREPEPAVFEIEIKLLWLAFQRRPRCSSPRSSRRAAGHILWQAERFADFPDRAARTIARDDGRQRRACPAVSLINPLNYFFTALMLEIHVDIGRLATLFAHKTLKQKSLPHRINRGDAEHVTDRGIGGRAAALGKEYPCERAKRTMDSTVRK